MKNRLTTRSNSSSKNKPPKTPRASHAYGWASALALLILLSSCTLPTRSAPPSSENPAAAQGAEPVDPAQDLPRTEVTFWATVPAGSPEDAAVYLTVVDEVTGLALNTRRHAMQPAEGGEPGAGARYTVKLPIAVGAVLKYRYEREAGGATVAEHLSSGEPVRYRMYVVDGPGEVQDVIGRWTDTAYTGATGRIMGQAADSATGLPLPNVLVAAGGVQTLTAADGSFLLEGLPAGVHNLVAYALDGAYRSFQQGARVAAESTTPAPIQLSPAAMVEVAFIVTLPEDTPPVVPVRFAGNFTQLGATFAALAGGMSGLPERMPVLAPLPDGRYSLKLNLPAGADLRYKYTLGDGFWNAEHAAAGEFIVRQLIVPANGGVIEDQVASWQTTHTEPISIDLTVPASTPSGETISIQFKPIFGWTEPIPLWPLGGNRWAYLLYGPLNLPGALEYRFCRNNQCSGDPLGAIDLQGEQRSISVEIASWPDLPAAEPQTSLAPEEVIARGAGFISGVAFHPEFHPSWTVHLPSALQTVKGMSANWLVLPVTWTYTRAQRIALEAVPGKDPLWPDLVAAIETARSLDLQVALYPQMRWPGGSISDFWMASPHDFAWWPVWFERYRTFILHHARLAETAGAPLVILGGDAVAPALPGGLLPDGSPSGVPADAAQRWRTLIDEIRTLYSGELYWSLTPSQMMSPPDFLDAADGIYLTWTDPLAESQDGSDPLANAAIRLDSYVRPIQLLYAKPLVIAASFDAASGPQAQAEAYRRLLGLVASRDWISGFVSEGYFFPAPVANTGASVNGLPAGEVLRAWFARFNGS